MLFNTRNVQSGTFAPFWLAWRSGVELRRDSLLHILTFVLLALLAKTELEVALSAKGELCHVTGDGSVYVRRAKSRDRRDIRRHGEVIGPLWSGGIRQPPWCGLDRNSYNTKTLLQFTCSVEL
jgi:hypothetical protein